MRVTSRVFCLLVAATVLGCGGERYNPNESTFPGAPGSSIPEAQQSAARGGGMSTGDGSSLPSTYPGMEKFRAGGEAAKSEQTAEAAATEGVSEAPAPSPAIEPAATDSGLPAPAASENEAPSATKEPFDKPAVVAEPAAPSEPAVNP